MALFIATLSTLSSVVLSHSWVRCADYTAQITGGDYDESNCRGWIRDCQFNNVEFGKDQGFNHQPAVGGGQALCQGAMGGISSDYARKDRIPKYKVGQTVRLVWPAKNHANYECFNFIPDTSMKLFVNPQVNPTEDLPNDKLSMTGNGWEIVRDWQEGCTPGTDGCGFQNCPKFCQNTDRATCFGDFIVPNDGTFSKSGYYTFAWYWIFNPGNPYVSCFEAYIDVDNDGSSITPDGASAGDPNNGKPITEYMTEISYCFTGTTANVGNTKAVAISSFADYVESSAISANIDEQTSDGYQATITFEHPTSNTKGIQSIATSKFCDAFTAKYSGSTCEICSDIMTHAVYNGVKKTTTIKTGAGTTDTGGNTGGGDTGGDTGGNTGGGNNGGGDASWLPEAKWGKFQVINRAGINKWHFAFYLQNIGDCQGKISSVQIRFGSTWRSADNSNTLGSNTVGEYAWNYDGKTTFDTLLPITIRVAFNDGSSITMWNKVTNLNGMSVFGTDKTCSSKSLDAPWTRYAPDTQPNYDGLPAPDYGMPMPPTSGISDYVVSFTAQDLIIIVLAVVNINILIMTLYFCCYRRSTKSKKYSPVKVMMMTDSEDDEHANLA